MRSPRKNRPDMHKEDVLCALHKLGWTLNELAVINGMSRSSLGHAFAYQRPRCEAIIAAALGLQPWDIWPSRYRDQKPFGARRFRTDFPAPVLARRPISDCTTVPNHVTADLHPAG